MKSLTVIALAIFFTQCEKDDDIADNNKNIGNVLINGETFLVKETSMFYYDDSAMPTMSIGSICSDGTSSINILFNLPSLDNIEGTYMDFWAYDYYLYWSEFYTYNEDGEKINRPLRDGEVTISNISGDNYKFDLFLVYGDWGTKFDTITGSYTAILEK